MSLQKKVRKHLLKVILLFLILTISISFIALFYYAKSLTSEKNIFNNVQEKILTEVSGMEQVFKQVDPILKEDSANLWSNLENLDANTDFLMLVYDNDSLIYWNNNILSNDLGNINLKKISIISDQSGWYLVYNKIEGNFKVIICKQIKSVYLPFNDISHTISHGLVSCKNLKFTQERSKNIYRINDPDGNFLVGMYFQGSNFISHRAILYLFIIFFFGYLFILILIISLYDGIKNKLNKHFLLFLFLIFDLVIIRVLEFSFRFPKILKDSGLYEQKFDIFPTFNSPGDMIISALIILLIAVYFFRLERQISYEKSSRNKLKVLIMSIITFLFMLFTFFIIGRVIEQLPYNAFFGFSLIGVNTYLFISALLFLMASLFIFIHAVTSYFFKNNVKLYLLDTTVVFIAFLLLIFLPEYWKYIAFSSLITILILWIYFYFYKRKKQSFYKYTVLIIIYAFATSIVVNYARLDKKDKHQIETLKILSDPHDKILENTFKEYKNEISNDRKVADLLTSNSLNNKLNLEKYLKQHYFSALTEKYNIQFTICRPNEMLEIKPEDIIINCSTYFNDFFNNPDNEEVQSDLYLISGNPESIYYIGKTSVEINKETINIFVEFFFTYVPEGLGYTEILVSNSPFNIDLSDYSFARYSNGQLLNKFGDYPYLTNFKQMQNFPDNKLFNLNNYRHIIYELSPDNYLILSRPKDRLSVHLVTFSVLFVIFIIILFVLVLLLFGKEANEFIRLSFQSRLQVIFLSTISLIIILLTAITLFYADVDIKNRLISQLNEKTNSVIIELQHKLSEQEDFFDVDQADLQFLLRKFSMIFFSDINLYSPSGELISTSRPEIFDHGLLANRINPKAYEGLFYKNQLFLVLKEKLGKTSYYSSYAPIVLRGNKTAGIINLPYFAKQSEINRSYYLMIFTFFDLFVILGIVGTIIAILLSRIISKPLLVLQEKLSAIKIDQRNEIIEWKTKDEIGQLIEAYNQMIEKLEASTELLKQSERESAWREVAQQIAHEIKNPLTPMKLNIQYLEKAFHENDPQLDEKVKNISKLLINQIETLNKVAEMFADFAKTKTGKFEKVDLVKVINESILLYKNNSNIRFTVEVYDSDHYTTAIEKDLARLFNNLIKNAIHSIGDRKNGEIIFRIDTKEDYHQVDILDNGKGIPDKFKANIFQPYFTTKSKGTGLGLAIVKNIITEIGGQITFTSKSDIGTTFSLKFPVTKE